MTKDYISFMSVFIDCNRQYQSRLYLWTEIMAFQRQIFIHGQRLRKHKKELSKKILCNRAEVQVLDIKAILVEYGHIVSSWSSRR